MLYAQMNGTDQNELFYSLAKAINNVYGGQIPRSGIIEINNSLMGILKENEEQQCWDEEPLLY